MPHLIKVGFDTLQHGVMSLHFCEFMSELSCSIGGNQFQMVSCVCQVSLRFFRQPQKNIYMENVSEPSMGQSYGTGPPLHVPMVRFLRHHISNKVDTHLHPCPGGTPLCNVFQGAYGPMRDILNSLCETSYMVSMSKQIFSNYA